jgi:hypothetical protein
MKFPIFVLVGIIGVAVANDTASMTEEQKQKCNFDLSSMGGRGCCDYQQCPLCTFYQRCCHKNNGWEVGTCKCGIDLFAPGTCY